MLETMRIKPFQKRYTVPGDKSISHRAVLFGAIAKGKTYIDGFLHGEDCLSTVSCLRQLGVDIQMENESSLVIYGQGVEGLQSPLKPLDVGNSGTTIRLMLGILAGTKVSAVLVGDDSIARRPMSRVVEPLRLMGAQIEGREHGRFTPLTVQGSRLSGTHYNSPIASAQVKSALLLAGLQAEGKTVIRETIHSRNHTEMMLPGFGVEVITNGLEVMVPGKQSLIGTHVKVPGDLSSAAFLWAAALMVPGSRMTVEDVGINPTRTGILDVFVQMGATVEIEQTGVWCNEPIGNVTVYGDDLKGVEIGGTLIPRLIDEIPILAVIAAQANGRTIIRDASELKVKETNRITTTVMELQKIGVNISETEDGMVIEGGNEIQGGMCSSHGDHRIGMALAIAGLAARDGVRVNGAEAIKVSFPSFESIITQLSV
ncbi:3-phosphoshikimate 1-carboxyvinyltransferase [Polycladospora coralii]|nr:3-phosphoshikimate 1-carboxyvinyltransferase [Polycladospora coralii]